MAQNIISISDFCNHYQITLTFVEMLEQHGIIELQSKGSEKFIDTESLGELEHFRILHFDLDINIEGIDVINTLLHRQSEMAAEIIRLRNAIQFYESIATGEAQEQ